MARRRTEDPAPARSTRPRRGSAAPARAPAAPAKDLATTRRRRRPEEAREAILVAADRLFAADGPERVGLASVARAVGVTHGLVTHYYGTFAGLVREVFVRRNRQAAATLLEQIVAAHDGGDFTGLARFAIDFVSDEVRARLFLWLRFNDPESAGKARGEGASLLRVLIDAIERELPALVARRQLAPLDRAALEDVVLLTLSAGHGYAIGKRAWLRGLGRAADAAADEAFRRTLHRAITGLLAPAVPDAP